MKKLLAVVIFLVLLGAVFYFRYTQSTPIIPAVSNILPTQNINAQRPAIPQELIIKSLNVNAIVESVAMDETGAMDVPKDADNVAWYNLGPRPGEQGSAVIAGHLDKETGAPAVFWNITKLQKGDEIEVIDKDGKTYTYIVERAASYPYLSFPLQLVFAENDKKRLNLITCGGTWDADKKVYSERYVVFAIEK